ncbi:hypothetical protein P8452_67427 [Trifolium repens]|nr:hypothetical protein P8452_67427 [Trifolium repens]
MSSIFVVVEHLLMHDDVVLVVFVLLLLFLLLFVFPWLFDLLLSFLLVFKGSEKKNDLALELVVKIYEMEMEVKEGHLMLKVFKKGWCCCGGGGGGETVVIMMGDKDNVN